MILPVIVADNGELIVISQVVRIIQPKALASLPKRVTVHFSDGLQKDYEGEAAEIIINTFVLFKRCTDQFLTELLNPSQIVTANGEKPPLVM